MTVAFSYAVQANVLNWIAGTPMPTPPTQVLMGLLTAAPNPDGTGVSEPPGGSGYTRKQVTFGAVATLNGVSSISNTNAIIFGPSTAAWPQVSWAALFDQNGNMIAYGPLAAARTAPANDTISFGAGTIQQRLQ